MIEKKREISHFNLIDWDFKSEDSNKFLHNFCWYPARFIPIIPAHLIQALSRPNDTMLDPFCGSGTSLLEGLKLGRNTIGIDLNPVGCFIANTKIETLKGHGVDTFCLMRLAKQLADIDKVWGFYKNSNSPILFEDCFGEVNNIPNYEENSKWFESTTLKMLGYLYKTIEALPVGPTRNISKLFFMSILIPSSGHENEKPYTYYADNVKPKKRIFKNAISIYLHKINKFLSEFDELQKNDQLPKVEVINDDVRNLSNLFKYREKVDLIVTSPPYLNVTDYTAAFRLIYLWNYFSENINDIKNQEIGARYKRKRSNRVDDYMEAMKSSLREMANVLKEKGYLCLILGEPKKYHEMITENVCSYITEILQLELVDTFSRNIIKKFFIHPIGGVHSEDILIFRKKSR